MEPQVKELLHVAIIVGAAVLLVGLLVLAGFLGWRQYQVWRHGRISKQRRYEATQIDLFHKRAEGEESGRSGRRHHHRRRRHSPALEIDLFRSRATQEDVPTGDGEPAGQSDKQEN